MAEFRTAFPETAQFGTGSGSTVAVQEAKIAVVADQGIGLGAYGSVWWSLEQRYGLRFTPIAVNALNGDLSAFNAIITNTAWPAAAAAPDHGAAPELNPGR